MFSDRRHVIGNEFRAKNPEFYPGYVEEEQVSENTSPEPSINGQLKQEYSEQIDLKRG